MIGATQSQDSIQRGRLQAASRILEIMDLTQCVKQIHNPVVSIDGIEEWRTLEEYPRFQVSNYGRFARDGEIIEPPENSFSYLVVHLTNRKKQRNLGLHRLVLETFGPERPSSNHLCAHNDGSRTNNWIWNLRWATPAENMHDRTYHEKLRLAGRRVEKFDYPRQEATA